MSKRPLIWSLVLAVLVAFRVVAINAHPGASSDIVVELGGRRTVDVLLTTLPESLLLKLQAMAEGRGRSIAAPAPNAPAADRIAAYRDVLLTTMTVRADDARIDLEWIGLEAPGAIEDQRSGKIVARMRGRLLPDGQSITVQTRIIFGSYPLIVRRAGEPDVVSWLDGDEISRPISRADRNTPSRRQAALSGLALGFSHIVPKGLDHVLFIIGLFLLTPRIRALLLQVSLFTAAHTVTLAATALGVLTPPASLIEPLIAMSIVFIAVENVVSARVSRWRLTLVFLFGLLHGMGFAGVLTSMNLSPQDFGTTLVSFNVGVELAQIAILAAAAAIVRLAALDASVYRRRVVRPASLAIAAAGVVWAIERMWLSA